MKEKPHRRKNTIPGISISGFAPHSVFISMKISRDERKYCIILAVLTITGLILRFHHIDSNSFWPDEAIT
jgi:hypothetical protein